MECMYVAALTLDTIACSYPSTEILPIALPKIQEFLSMPSDTLGRLKCMYVCTVCMYCMYVCMHVCMTVCMYVCMKTSCIRIKACFSYSILTVCIHFCSEILICTYIHLFIHTSTHTYIHTYIEHSLVKESGMLALGALASGCLQEMSG